MEASVISSGFTKEIGGSYIVLLREISDWEEGDPGVSIATHEFENMERRASLGDLATGIAQDLQNIFQNVRLNSQVVRASLPHSLPQSGKLINALEDGALGLKMASDLTEQLLLFSKGNSGKREKVHLQFIIPVIVRMLSGQVSGNVQIETELDNDCPPLQVDPADVGQIVINLCNTAFDSMPPNGGNVKISLFPPPSRGEGSIEIKISDNGRGMSEKVRQQIFDPSYSSPDSAGVEGMGLIKVKRVVDKLNGEISVSSELAKGYGIQDPTSSQADWR